MLKKIFRHHMTMLLSIFLLGLFISCAISKEETIPIKKLPEAVLNAFNGSFPNAKIKTASKEEKDGQVVYEIESIDGKQNRDLLYAADGTVLENEEEIKFDELPEQIRQTIEEKYPNAEIEKCEKISKGSVIEFEIGLEIGETEHEILLDSKGNVIKTKSSNEEDEKENEEDDDDE